MFHASENTFALKQKHGAESQIGRSKTRQLSNTRPAASGMSALGQKQTFRVQLGMSASANSGHTEAPLFRISNEHSSAGQDNPDFGELAELCIDLD